MPIFLSLRLDPTRVSNPRLPLQRQTLYPLRHLIGNANDAARLQILESLFVQEHAVDLKVDTYSVLLKIFNT